MVIARLQQPGCLRCHHDQVRHENNTGHCLVEVDYEIECSCDDYLDIERLAKTGFEAYSHNAGGRTFDGRPIPTWDELGEIVREHWRVAARKMWELLEQ